MSGEPDRPSRSDSTAANGGQAVTHECGPRVLSARDYAELKGIPLRSLRRYLAQGLIPGAERVGPGKKWRITTTTPA